MPSTLDISRVILSFSVLSAFASAHSMESSRSPSHLHHRDTLTYVGCYSSSDPLTQDDTYQYQSSGYCQQQCLASNNQAVLGLTNGNACYCGNELPATSDKVDDSNCDSPCTGYGQDDCGGDNYWSIYTTGSQTNVQAVGGSAASSAASSSKSSTSAASSAASSTAASSAATSAASKTTAAPSVVTSVAPGETVVVTLSASAGPDSTSSATATPVSKKSSSTNVAGIAAGVVVGVVVIAAIILGTFLYLRHKRRREAEDNYRKNQVNDFMGGGKRRSPGPEQRIDTEAMAQRRQSDGSIADNEDFSHRILKVTNPDDGR